MKMKLRFPVNHIAHWAEQYDYQVQETDLNQLVPQVTKCGFITLDQLRIVAKWKSPRSAGHVDNNSDEYVKAITGFALKTNNERARIEVLTILDGVSWPTASVILHFFHIEKYPVLDFRALWSVGMELPSQYDFEFWWNYVVFCRGLADRTSHDMRTLDRALWAYSKQNHGDSTDAGRSECSVVKIGKGAT
jgi:hypothetical protein